MEQNSKEPETVKSLTFKSELARMFECNSDESMLIGELELIMEDLIGVYLNNEPAEKNPI